MRTALSDLVDRLAAFDVSEWNGLPVGLAIGESATAATLELGDEHMPADMVHLAGSARAWSRAGEVVLIDVALQPEPAATALSALGPADTEAVRYGLVRAEERVYAARGLTAIAGAGGDIVRHVIGFIPTSAAEYRRTLRPGLATTRRPLETT